MTFFTVVIPTYNKVLELCNTVESVLRQTFIDFELLIMDDGSTDSTGDLINTFTDKRITYEWQTNSGGPASPRNRGILAANSPWISFLDADDIWYPTRLEEVYKAIILNHDSGVFCHNEMISKENTKVKKLRKYGPYNNHFYETLLMHGNCLSTSATTVKTELLNKYKLNFNESSDYVIVEDYDLWLRLAQIGVKFTFINIPLGEYMIGKDNISNDTLKLRRNLLVLLHQHVFEIQDFETDCKKIWRKVMTKIRVDDFITKFKEYDVRGALMYLFKAFETDFGHSVQTLLKKIYYKFKKTTRRH